MGSLQQLAAELGAQERTLRRAASQGALRARRPGARRLRLAPGERDYLRAHWSLLAGLRRTLRTERDVRLAVLYGSVARGEEDADSDLDLLVAFADDRAFAGFGLAARLGGAVGRRVDLANLAQVEERSPLLLGRVLEEGRVLVDRDGQWADLRARRRAIQARARRSHRRQMRAATRAIDALSDPGGGR